MTLETRELAACLKKSERDPKVRSLLAALGIKQLAAPKRETWKSRFMDEPVTVLNGLTTVAAPKHGVTLRFDFPATRDGFSERPVSYKGPRVLERIELSRRYVPPVLLEWTMADPLEVLRRTAREKGKAYAKGPGKTPDSIRIGKVCFVITRAPGNTRAARVVLEP